MPREWANRRPSRDNALAVHSLDVHCTKRQAKRTRGSEFRAPWPQVQGRTWLAWTWRGRWSLGHGGTGPYGPTPSARPSAANTRARHCFLASASGPKLWPYVCAVIKLNINTRPWHSIYRYEMCHLAVTCYKNYGTWHSPPNSTGVPSTRTRYALASKIGLLAGHACVLARALPPWLKNQLW